MDNKDLDQKIDNLLQAEVVDRHSLFQLKYFIIGKEPTHQSKLWRCLREIESRKESIEQLKLEIDNIKDKKELLNLDISDLKKELKEAENHNMPVEPKSHKKSEIKVRMNLRRQCSLDKNIKNLNKKLKFLYQEMDFFYRAYLSLEAKEPLKPYDDFDSQAEYWNEKLSQEFNLKAIFRQIPPTELIGTILALNNDANVKKELIGLIDKLQNDQEKILLKENTSLKD